MQYSKAGTQTNAIGAFPDFTSVGTSLGVVPRFQPLSVDAASGGAFDIALNKNRNLLVDENNPRILKIGFYRPGCQPAGPVEVKLPVKSFALLDD